MPGQCYKVAILGEDPKFECVSEDIILFNCANTRITLTKCDLNIASM